MLKRLSTSGAAAVRTWTGHDAAVYVIHWNQPDRL